MSYEATVFPVSSRPLLLVTAFVHIPKRAWRSSHHPIQEVELIAEVLMSFCCFNILYKDLVGPCALLHLPYRLMFNIGPPDHLDTVTVSGAIKRIASQKG